MKLTLVVKLNMVNWGKEKLLLIFDCTHNVCIKPQKCILSFTHPYVIINLYACFFFSTQRWYFEQSQWGSFSVVLDLVDLHCMDWSVETFFKISSFCVAELRKSYRFGMTWGWVYDYSRGVELGGTTMLGTCPYQYPATTKMSLTVPKYVYVFVISDASETSYHWYYLTR